MATIFDDVTGTTTAFDSTKITDSSKSFDINRFRSWDVTVDSSVYNIDTNTSTELFFPNTVSANGAYTISFVTRTSLQKFDDDAASSTKMPDTLLSSKIGITKTLFDKKIKAKFMNLYSVFSTTDPMTLIYNLGELKQPFAYYVLYEIYTDLMIDQEDINVMKSEMFFNKFKNSLNDCMSLLAVDMNESGSISNAEQDTNVSRGILLSR